MSHRLSVDPVKWTQFVESHPDSHTLQTHEWGRFKSEFGWSAETVAVGDDQGQIRAGALILYRRAHRLLPLSVAYIPAGPLLSGEAQIDQALWKALDQAAQRRGAVFLKVEPCDWYRARPGLREMLQSAGFQESSDTIQPPRTVVIPLTGTEEDMLKRMNQSTRYKAKLGPKKEVDIRYGNAADVASFNAIMGITGTRDGFSTHEPAYYQRAFELFQAGDRCTLVMASHAGRDLAGLMIFRCGDKSFYLYGASSNEERNRMPTYIAQWAAIRWAKQHGSSYHDLWGIPDFDEATLEADFETRHEGLWGVYGAKRGWGGSVVRSVGAWDKVYIPPAYAIYRRLRP
jgi:lipid II:glycine glycyltransferase (peptidoglycan interpeptide bridge formation enzyme)